MLLDVYKGPPMASINLVDVTNDYIASNDHMKHMFGIEFKPSDQLHVWVIMQHYAHVCLFFVQSGNCKFMLSLYV